MLYFKQFLLLLVCLAGAIHGDEEPREINGDVNNDIILAILKYLGEHNKCYSYKTGSVLQSFLKADKLEVTADIQTACTYPCTGGIIRCDSIFRKAPDGDIWNIAGMVCAPQEPHFDEVKETNPVIHREPIEELKKIANQNVQYNRPCLGCPSDIDIHAEGVNSLVSAALKHVESEHNEKHILLRVLRVQQQVVAGIKYILLIEIAPTICSKNVDLLTCPVDQNKESFICEVEYWEKPWEHSSLIIKNNCTSSQNYKVEDPINTTKKPVHRDLEPDFMSELESQIIPEQEFNQNKHSLSTNEIPQEAPINYYDIDYPHQEPEVIIQRRFVREVSSSSSSSSSSNKDKDKLKKENLGNSSNSSSSSSSSSASSSHEHKQKDEKNKINDDSSSSSSSENNDIHKKEQASNVNAQMLMKDSEKNEQQINDNLIDVIRKQLRSANIDIVGKSKVVLDETHYKVDLLVEKDREVEECSVFITVADDVNASTVDKIVCGKDRFKRQLAGGIQPTSKDNPKLKSFLNQGLLQLDSQSTHTTRYKIKEVISATSQVVSGSLYRVKAKVVLSDCEKGKDVNLETCGTHQDPHEQICDFKIWSQPWLPNGTQTNMTCESGALSFRAKRETGLDEQVIAELKFMDFMYQFGKEYTTKMEYVHRLKVFKDNLKRIDLMNKYEKGTAHYIVTKFADLTPKEFSQLHGLRTDLQNENEIPFPDAEIPDIELPTSFDWRDQNAVTEVKDQGSCGSCWAFSTTGNIEGQYAIKYKKLKEFSEQELVDCDKLDEGCNGGLMDNAYRTIEKIGGLELESDYPYDAEDEKCHFSKAKVAVQLSGALNISHDETDMAKWLTQNGPISIAINANAMQFYAGGVSHPWKTLCNPKNLDHGVLIVGYGVHTTSITKKVLPYWIVKNSWGKSWGEQGYYRVYRGDGTCGLNQTPSSAIVA